MSRKALGRGLDALIPQSPASSAVSPHSGGSVSPDSVEVVKIVSTSEIVPNRRQPRTVIADDKLVELADSIRERGVLEPLLVRPMDDGRFELIAGERRWRACQRAGLSEIPVLVRDIGDRASLEIALIENIQREDLNPVDEANAYRQLVEEYGRTHAEISKAVGKDRSTVTNLLRLLKLSGPVLQLVSEGRLSVGHARALLNVEHSDLQHEIAEKMVQEGWSVRQAERFVAGQQPDGGPEPTDKPESKPAPSKDPQVVRVEEALRRVFGTEVRLEHSSKGGRIEIKYFSQEELERILELLGAEVL